jgi:hypothetical protein
MGVRTDNRTGEVDDSSLACVIDEKVSWIDIAVLVLCWASAQARLAWPGPIEAGPISALLSSVTGELDFSIFMPSYDIINAAA